MIMKKFKNIIIMLTVLSLSSSIYATNNFFEQAPFETGTTSPEDNSENPVQTPEPTLTNSPTQDEEDFFPNVDGEVGSNVEETTPTPVATPKPKPSVTPKPKPTSSPTPIKEDNKPLKEETTKEPTKEIIGGDGNTLTYEEWVKQQEKEQQKYEITKNKEEFIEQGVSQEEFNPDMSLPDELNPFVEDSNYNVNDFNPQTDVIKKERGQTIQYTLNLSEKYPRYVDTGFEVDKNGNIEYAQCQDVFKLLSVKLKGFYIEDSDKTMVILKGIPIVIEDNGKLINFNEIMSNFKDDNVEIKPIKTRIEGQYNMTEMLEMTKNIKVKINDEDIELGLEPVIKEGNVLFALRPIAAGLENTINWNKETGIATVYNKEHNLTFTYSIHSNIVTINDKQYELPIKPELNLEHLRILTTINLLVEKTGARSEFDTKTKTLHLYTKDYVNYDF